ncbi:MAG: cysteine hydrolase [Chloroflexi bacterium]|nr:cysteine hydrolase [Chloroflexota bacterium]
MKELYGKMVYETLGEIVDPKHTAVIVVDMQNDGCHWDGDFARHGFDISEKREMIPNLVRFVEEARRAGLLIVWTMNTNERAGRSLSPAWLYFRLRESKHGVVPGYENDIEGTWGQKIVDELKPLPEEPIVKKHRSSVFVDTSLNAILRSNKIETVIIAGTVTQGCVESTARGAAEHDYYVVILSDCVASQRHDLHEAALKVLASRYDVVTSKDVIAEWTRLAARTA